jgi:hypothetical protein
VDPSKVVRLLSDPRRNIHYIPENILEIRLEGEGREERVDAVKNLLQGLA